MHGYKISVGEASYLVPINDSLTYRPSSQGWAPMVLPFLFYLLFVIACLLMFVYVWMGLGFFLSLLTSSYDAMNMFFHAIQELLVTKVRLVFKVANWVLLV